MSVELRDRKSPRVKELTEDEEACLFEDAGGNNAKQENAPPPVEADASEGPVEEVIVIDLEGEEDAEAGRLSPRGSAYSVISSMDAADNKSVFLNLPPICVRCSPLLDGFLSIFPMKKIVRDLTRAASSGSSSHRHHGKSPEDHSVGSSEVVDLRGRVSQLESELSTAKDTVRLQKEQLDKSLMEYTSALQRIVSLEKTIEAKRDVEEQNEQLQERVIELISESQDSTGPSIVETKSLGPLSLEEAAMIIDAQQQPVDLCSKAVVKLTDGSEVSLDDAATRISDMEKRLSNLVLIEDPMKPGRRWYGERELQECLDAVCANQTRLEAVASSSSFSSEACTGTDVNENVSREEAPRLRRSIAELGRDEGEERVDARHSTAEKDESKMRNGVKWLEGDDGWAVSRHGEFGGAAVRDEDTLVQDDKQPAESAGDLERHLINAMEDHLMRRQVHLDRALGFSLASKMMEAAASSSAGGDTEELVMQLQQEIAIKTKLCDQLALRLADCQSAMLHKSLQRGTGRAILAL
ncbi:hypothetical protein FOZ60_016407 [Perkinsus olseni]|uniref:Uncharacterized protein n=1 Tax=Perkinsus olseni TaxID=32597 RepID=A0A7J6N3Y4_PEROL|nr:hypothetical protein FOZ60_016407 [Perkinsus olseni]